MKKTLSILLIALALCAAVAVPASAALSDVIAGGLGSILTNLPGAMETLPLLPNIKDITRPDITGGGKTKIPSLDSVLRSFNVENMDKATTQRFLDTLQGVKDKGQDMAKYLAPAEEKLPYAVKNAIHKAGIKEYPIYERSAFFNFIFKWFLFGWAWM